MTRRKLGVIAGVAATVTGCSLLVHFDDASVDSCADGGCLEAGPADAGGDAPPDPCATRPDDASCGDADPCNAAPTCHAGQCVRHPNDSGAICGYLGACECQYCSAGACSDTKACPQGFNWEAGVDIARCCSGLPVLTDTNANCGVCGIECRTAGVSNPQDCKLLGGHYQCVDCAANSDCWSGCCAIDTTPYHCSASDCNTGACVPGLCPAPSTCVPGSNGPNYCSYD